MLSKSESWRIGKFNPFIAFCSLFLLFAVGGTLPRSVVKKKVPWKLKIDRKVINYRGKKEAKPQNPREALKTHPTDNHLKLIDVLKMPPPNVN